MANKHVLPDLPYAHDALEPYIDVRTMEIHHGKHHQAYVNNLNNAIEGTEMENMSLEDIFKNMSQYPMAVRNNGGGHWNHDLFWKIMGPDGGGKRREIFSLPLRGVLPRLKISRKSLTVPVPLVLAADGPG